VSRRALAQWSVLSLLASSCLVGNLEVRDKPNGGAAGDPSSGGAADTSSAGEGASASPGGGALTQGGSAMQGGTATQQGGEPGASGGTNTAGGDTSQAGDGSVGPTHKCGDFNEVNDVMANSPATYGGNKFKEGLLFCAAINSGHYDAAKKLVDNDGMLFDLLEDGDYRATLVLETPDPTADVRFTFSANGGTISWAALDRAVNVIHGYKGMAQVSVEAHNPKAIAESVPYKIRIHQDDLAAHCATTMPAAGTYAEQNDGTSFDGNDVIRYDFKKDVQVPTSNPSDAPEPSGLVVENGKRFVINGTSADAHYGQTYADADMFAFETGDISQVSVRLVWTGRTDLDVILFNEDGYQYIAVGSDFTKDSVSVFAVRPHTKYWAYVVANENLAVLPQSYQLNLCGETFSE
jgi:hypothetical protein